MSKARRSGGSPPIPLKFFTVEHRGSEPLYGHPKGILLQLGSPDTPVTFPFGIWRHGMTYRMFKTKVELVTPEQQDCVRFLDEVVRKAVGDNVQAHGQGPVPNGCYVGHDPKPDSGINGNFYKCMCSEPSEGKSYPPSITCEFNCLQSGDLLQVTADTPPITNLDTSTDPPRPMPLHLWPSWRTTYRVAKEVPGQDLPAWHRNVSPYPVIPCEMIHITAGSIKDMTTETFPYYINKTMSPGNPDLLNPPTPKKMYGSVVMRIGRSYHHKNTVGIRRYGNRILIMDVEESRARCALPSIREEAWLACAATHSPDSSVAVDEPTDQTPATMDVQKEAETDPAAYY